MQLQIVTGKPFYHAQYKKGFRMSLQYDFLSSKYVENIIRQTP